MHIFDKHERIILYNTMKNTKEEEKKGFLLGFWSLKYLRDISMQINNTAAEKSTNGNLAII